VLPSMSVNSSVSVSADGDARVRFGCGIGCTESVPSPYLARPRPAGARARVMAPIETPSSQLVIARHTSFAARRCAGPRWASREAASLCRGESSCGCPFDRRPRRRVRARGRSLAPVEKRRASGAMSV
jgi:hypothetical protein